MEIQKIQAYKCPHCAEISLSLKEIEKHKRTCRKNPEYTQKCIQCACLNGDFILTNLRGKGICVHTGPYGGKCPYCNHDDAEVQKRIQESHDAYTKYSCYSSDISPQENWKKEDRYDELREKGYTPEEARKEVYSN